MSVFVSALRILSTSFPVGRRMGPHTFLLCWLGACKVRTEHTRFKYGFFVRAQMCRVQSSSSCQTPAPPLENSPVKRIVRQTFRLNAGLKHIRSRMLSLSCCICTQSFQLSCDPIPLCNPQPPPSPRKPIEIIVHTPTVMVLGLKANAARQPPTKHHPPSNHPEKLSLRKQSLTILL